MEHNLKVRLSKSGKELFKETKYKFILNGELISEIDYNNLTVDLTIPIGKNIIEIGVSEYYIKKDIILNVGQRLAIGIYPNLSHQFFRGFLIGLSVFTIFIQYLILEKINIPIMFISIIPILTFWNRRNESFSITVQKN
jgi:hypothetical protein